MLKVISTLLVAASSRIVDFSEIGGIHDDHTNQTSWNNGQLLNRTLNDLQSGDVFVIPNKTFSFMGGIIVNDLKDAIF